MLRFPYRRVWIEPVPAVVLPPPSLLGQFVLFCLDNVVHFTAVAESIRQSKLRSAIPGSATGSVAYPIRLESIAMRKNCKARSHAMPEPQPTDPMAETNTPPAAD